MIKRLSIDIESCADCPYCRYNGDYGMSYESGWDCEHDAAPIRARIMDDEGSVVPVPCVLPAWCPLPEITIFDREK